MIHRRTGLKVLKPIYFEKLSLSMKTNMASPMSICRHTLRNIFNTKVFTQKEGRSIGVA